MMKRTLAILLTLFLFRGPDTSAQDSTIFIPRADEPLQLLTGYVQLAEDKDNLFTIENVINNHGIAFSPAASFQSIDPYRTWWLKLRVLPSFTSGNFYIGLPSQKLSGISQGNDKVDAWIVRNNTITRHYETGTLEPVSRRPVAKPINRNLFPVDLQKDQPFTVYWRIQRTVNFEPLQFDFALQHHSVLGTVPKDDDRLAWFYGGVMFILFMFGLVFFIITREKAFAWFFCIAANLYIHMQLLEPESNLVRWLFPEHPVYQFHLFILLTSSFAILILQFIRTFSKTKQLLPKWDKLIVGVMIYITVLSVADLVFLEVDPTATLPPYFFLLAFVTIIVIAVRLMLTRNLYARWNGFALLWLFVFQVLGIIWNIGLLPPWFPNPWAIAQIGMMVILFFGLAYRFKQSAKEKAEAARILEMDTIKSRFFANISHEFRTPLSLMLGPLKQLEENTVEPAQQKKYIGMMRRNGDCLLQLINQLLDLSKLESGKMELRVAKTDITGLLKAIASSFDSLAEQNQINYHVHFPEENITGFADRDKLEKVVVNLLSNAFRFTAANGTVSFSVEKDVQKAPSGEKRLRFTVQDNGTGMPKEQLDKIFDRFHQVAGTEGGTGIGLSLAKELLQLHKGQVSVQSEMGKGSSFRVSVPIAPEFYSAAEMTAVADEQATATAGRPTESINETEETIVDSSLPLVLVTEDNTDLQQFISDTLRPHFQVQVAAMDGSD